MTISDDEAIEAARAHLVAEAADLGAALTPDAVTVELLPTDDAGEARIFRASAHRDPPPSKVVRVGAVLADGTLVPGPQDALTRIFDEVHDAQGLAQAATFLFNPGPGLTAAIDGPGLAAVREAAGRSGADPAIVEPPALIDVDGRRGVQLWWIDRMGPARVRFFLDERGDVATAQQRLDELAGEG